MNNNQIDKFTQCVLESARVTDPMEARGPLIAADKIKKGLSSRDYRAAAKKSIIALLQNNFTYEAINWLGQGFKDFPELSQDPDVQKQAAIAYQSAKIAQLESAPDIKKFFALQE